MREGGNQSVGVGRTRAIGAGFVVAALALVATTVGAAASTVSVLPVGFITNATAPLAGEFVKTGDMIAAGWAISMPEKHPATTVALSGMTATIPFLCVTEGTRTAQSLVISLPTTSISIPADDNNWHPTSSSSSAAGYQASAAVPLLCTKGVLIPKGYIAYTAKLVSADTKDAFAMRFHAVDARAFVVTRDVSRSDSGSTDTSGGQPETSNTNCASPSQNTGLGQCTAAWTKSSTNTAAAPPTTGGGSGGGSGNGPGGGSGSGSGGGSGKSAGGGSGQGAGKGGKSLHRPVVVTHRSATRVSTVPTTAQARALTPAVSAPVPVLVVPAPTPTPTVLGPVPLMVPVIDNTASQVGAALPWTWFALLALLDLGLIVGVVLRRRHRRADPLHAR
jgi:hypothetical protein